MHIHGLICMFAIACRGLWGLVKVPDAIAVKAWLRWSRGVNYSRGKIGDITLEIIVFKTGNNKIHLVSSSLDPAYILLY
jgi:hypothetical protein